jgi:hypothetical protein
VPVIPVSHRRRILRRIPPREGVDLEAFLHRGRAAVVGYTSANAAGDYLRLAAPTR